RPSPRPDLIFLGRCRAAALKGGRRPSRNDLPLMVASTAADLLDWGGRFQEECLFERVSSRDLMLPITTIPRGACHQARASRRKLVFVRSVRIATMMQSCASAAKLRGGGPILRRGSKTKSQVGLPPPRSVSCSLASR